MPAPQSHGTRIAAAIPVPGTFVPDRGSGTARIERQIVGGTPFQANWIGGEEEGAAWLPAAGDAASAGDATLERCDVAAMGGAMQGR